MVRQAARRARPARVSGVPAERLRELSMGMSHDFEVAIEEGATMVRVGRRYLARDITHESHSTRSRQQRFQTVMRGYDRGEVQAFLLEVADDYENALRENDKLRQDVAKLDAVLGEHRGQERNLRNTLLTAQKLADEIKEQAQKEAAHHRARGRRPRRPAVAEVAGAPRGRAARDRRAAHEAARGGERHRGAGPHAQHDARVHPRAGRPVARGARPAAPAAPG